MKRHIEKEYERVAKSFQAAIKLGTAETINTIGIRLALCHQAIILSRILEALDKAAEFRSLAMYEPDEEKADRHLRESILADREANLLWQSGPSPDALLSAAAIETATPDQLGAHAWLVYAGAEASAES